MLAAVASRGDITIKNCIPEHLDCITAKILEIGGNVKDMGDSIRVTMNKRPNKATVKLFHIQGSQQICNHKWELYFQWQMVQA